MPVTCCAYCGKEIDVGQNNFKAGRTGEPFCDDCKAEEEGGAADENDSP